MVLDAYIRVSRVAGRDGDSFISPAVQLEQIERWARLHNATLGKVFTELDESGARPDRPLLLEAIERVERGDTAGIVVAKLDRFGRSAANGIQGIKRIQDAGGTLVSVEDGLDLSTPTGKLVSQILLCVGEWELERVRTNWAIAGAKAIQRGVYTTAAPIGYRRGEGGRLTIDPSNRLIIEEIFSRRLDGEGCLAIARYLNERGFKTREGNRFNRQSVEQIARNPAYRGEARCGGFRNLSAHPAIIDAAVWHRVQASIRPPAVSLESSLGGIVRCFSCGRAMESKRDDRPTTYVNYCCVPRKTAEPCPAPAQIRAEDLDPLVEEFLFTRCRDSVAKRTAAEARRLGGLAEEAVEDLAVFRDAPGLPKTLGPRLFEEGLIERKMRVDRLRAETARALRGDDASLTDLDGLEQRWGTMSWPERRRTVGAYVDCVLVKSGQGSAIDRTLVFRRGSGPTLRKESALVAADPTTGEAEALRPVDPGPPARLEADLRGFLGSRLEWPSYTAFATAGEARLHARAIAWGEFRFGVSACVSKSLGSG